MGFDKILQLGDERLYQKSENLTKSDTDLIYETVAELHDAMMGFRARYKAGRAIAAPQIGVFKRLIYMNIDHPLVIINPYILPLNTEQIEVWDDCMCFPDLLVKVQRYRRIRLNFFDAEFNPQELILEDDLSELIQHEYDHLEGILATQRAIDDKSFRWRS